MWKIKDGETNIMEQLTKLQTTSQLWKITDYLPSFEALTSEQAVSFLDMPQMEQQQSIKSPHEEIANLTKRVTELEIMVKQPKDVDALSKKIESLANEVSGLVPYKADLKHLCDMNAYNAKDVTEQ